MTYPLVNVLTIAICAVICGAADYVLAVKQNQKKLYDDVSWFFLVNIEDNFRQVRVRRRTTFDKGHGRQETREYYICTVPRDFRQRKRWAKLAALGCVVSRVVRNGKTTCTRRCYILSKKLTAQEFAAAVRGHWGIENSLHWQLDVAFDKEQSRIRRGDLDVRKPWDDYQWAYSDALTRCNIARAPWNVIPADREWYRNLLVSRLLLTTLKKRDPQYPPADPALDGLVVE